MTFRVLTPTQALEDGHPPTVPPVSVNTRDAAALLGIGKRKMYELLDADEIESFYLGRLRLIPLSVLVEFVENKRAEAKRASI